MPDLFTLLDLFTHKRSGIHLPYLNPVGRTAGWAGIPTAFFAVFGTSITALVNREKVAEKTLFLPCVRNWDNMDNRSCLSTVGKTLAVMTLDQIL